jgi:hypothetical protein
LRESLGEWPMAQCQTWSERALVDLGDFRKRPYQIL